MEQQSINYSPTVRRVLKDLPRDSITAAELVQKILERHPEYASNTAREMAGVEFPPFSRQQSAEDWLAEARAMFDPVLVDKLHGRLVILALCRLDPEFGDYLRSFAAQIQQELTEDFDSLLLPEHAGKRQHLGRFLKILQGKTESASVPVSNLPTGESGFLVLTEGARRLEELVRLCFRQRNNTCLTAHYRMRPGASWSDFENDLSSDLKEIAAGRFATVGDFLPELGVNFRPGTSQRSWRHVVDGSAVETSSASNVSPTSSSLPALLDQWSNKKLPAGQRLVLFVEWHGVDAKAQADSLGLTDEVLKQISAPPDQVGIVFSGLPEGVRQQFSGSRVHDLKLPEEEPPRVSQALLNDMPAGPDRLKIVDEVQAIADAIALKKMHPPLVVGVFGGWGTGKSFVLHLIEDRLQELRCQAVGVNSEARSAYPFVGHPYLVRFDAWTYAKNNLWASLMQTTLVELDRQLSLEHELLKSLPIDPCESSPVWRLMQGLTDKQRKRLLKDTNGKKALETTAAFARDGSPSRLWAELERLREVEKKHLLKKEGELRDLRSRKLNEQRKLEVEVDEELARESRRVALAPVWDELVEQTKGGLDKIDAPTFAQVVQRMSFLQKIGLGFKDISWPIVAFMIVALGGGISVAVLTPVAELWATLTGGILAVTAPLVRAWSWIENRRAAYEQRLAAAQEDFQKLREARMEERLQVAEENSTAASVAELNARIEDSEARVERIRARLGVTGHSRSLNDFLKTRIEEGLYHQELGMLDQVQSDIQELSDTLVPAHSDGIVDRKKLDQLFPRGEPRVVLLIDDLDRCPPDKVVEVLEAAQLLVKTRLFVVVIAMDVRYVTRALESIYQGVLVRSGEPSGLDYIEKIIQIPYRVRSVSTPAIRSFLRSQMEIEEGTEVEEPVDSGEGQDDGEQDKPETAEEQVETARLSASTHATQGDSAELPSEVIQFQPDEFKAITDACSALSVSPRTMKRLVNVFKLLKIIWYRQGLEAGPSSDVKQSMLAILALCARYPEVLRKLLADMETAYRAKKGLGHRLLVEFLAEQALLGADAAPYPPDWYRVAEVLRRPDFIPERMTLGHLEEANLRLLTSFSFVGETDAEREATLQRGYYRGSNSRAPSEVNGGNPGAGTGADD